MNGSVKLGTPSACAHASTSSTLSDGIFVGLYGDFKEHKRQDVETEYIGVRRLVFGAFRDFLPKWH